jgi:hypothetical protein
VPANSAQHQTLNRAPLAPNAAPSVWDDISEENLGLTLVCSECVERSRHTRRSRDSHGL